MNHLKQRAPSSIVDDEYSDVVDPTKVTKLSEARIRVLSKMLGSERYYMNAITSIEKWINYKIVNTEYDPSVLFGNIESIIQHCTSLLRSWEIELEKATPKSQAKFSEIFSTQVRTIYL
eukprot:TRINITY_DN8685_c0_g1_i1.p1 TRINITY_DN8685_c0_g1~~TRINITY_DN8685_c0_g1_i1.p1  ORF type:complete len:119 (+),score=12.52 TRINITY_DN8685_c0_g1_i1:58-414(+)